MTTECNFTLGNISVTPEQLKIRAADGEEKTLQPKFIEVLVYLVRQYPRLVSRDELIEKIWLGNKPVGEKALTNAIWHLRQHFRNDDQPLIETVRKRGYRLLIAPQYGDNQSPVENKISVAAPSERQHKSFGLTMLTLAVLLLVVLSTLLNWQRGSEAKQLPLLTRITADPGRELFPAMSGDNRLMAYIWEKSDRSSNLFIKDLKHSDLPAKQLTFGVGDILGLVWHPDGEHIVYANEINGIRDGYQINIKTKSVLPLGVPGFSFPSFMPGGQSMIFHRWQTKEHLTYLPLDANVAMGAHTLLNGHASFTTPHFSQAANSLTYISNQSGHNEIWRSNAKGEDRQQLTWMKNHLFYPRWSPSGRLIAFLAPKIGEQGNALYVLDVDKLTIKQLNSPFNEHKRPTLGN